ncbi:MAG TPA: hypothetical protein VL096_22135, partial [Pirellulaceae bacterium]|nr:hypothetical protein [Pirellulaceae bacterium]
PDGQNIAGMVHNSGGPQPNVNGQAASGSGLQLEVWSLADAQRIHQISLPFNQQAFHCEYLTNSRIVVCYHETTRFYFVVYDITTGREVCAGSADDDEGNIHKVVLSPGRRYLWNPQRDSITVWDLTNGKIVGTATPPKSCDLTGLALSPDGKELLLGMERRGTSYVVVMDLLTKAVKQHLALKFSGRPNPFRGNFGRPISCQWTADGQQWLAGQQLIQQATGELVDSLPVSTGDTSKAGMLLDHDQLLSLSNELGVWVVELKPLKAQLLAMKDRTPGTRAGVSPGLNPTTMPGRVRPRPGGDPTPGDLYATLLASDPDTWKQQWQWCETLNRPIVGLRWGIGVQMPISPAQAQAVLQPRPANHAALHWLKSEAGPVGAELVELLQAKTKDGKFGEFAGLKESSLTDVMILGGGDRTQVMTSARRAGVDLALVICLQSVTRGKTKDMSMTIQVQDLASAKKVWESSSLLSSKVAETTARGGEPFANILAEVTKFIDEQLLLAPLSKMPRPTIIARADAAQLHRTNPMASLAELRLYDHHRAIGKASMLEASTKLLGDAGDAAKLAGDDAAARDAIVQKYHAQWQSK